MYGQNPETAPLNPEFIKRQTRLIQAQLLKSDRQSLGLIPEPFLPNFAETTTKLFKASFVSTYDLRTAGPQGTSLITSVKDQGRCESCWAFATMGAVEGYAKKAGKGEYDLSENNLKECHGFDALPCEGGNASKSSAYLARRSGPVSETIDPYSQEAMGCKEIVFPEFWITDIRYLPNEASILKQSLLDYGALYTTFFWDNSNYNSTNYTYYSNGETGANHAALLVGWDDTKITSGGTGAWIIKNSWGTSWGESGFFYISYNDTKVNSNVMFIQNISPTTTNSYQFSYDKLGMLNSLGDHSNIGYGLIRFSPGSRSYTLKKLSTFIPSGPATIRFDVYDDFDGSALSNLVGSIADKVCDLPGYYTFDLPTPITVNPNNDFYIKVYYNTVGYNYPIPIEYTFPGYAAPLIESNKCWTSFNDTSWMAVGSDQEWKLDLCINAYGEYTSNAPTIPVSNFSATDITYSSMNLSWTRGNGTGVIVVARNGNAPDSDPTDGATYTANPVFEMGQQIGNGNYVVYNGTGTNINITGLSSGNNYYFAFYEYNSTDNSYRIPPLVGNASTKCASYSLPFIENFEGGTMPNCWTQEAGPLKWQFITGDGSLGSYAHGGTHNAYLKDNSSTSDRNKLISPPLNLTGYTHTALKFWHTQDFNNSIDNHDDLKIYYKTSATGSWNLLATYTYFIFYWTQEILELPDPGSNYYIAFEGDAKGGHGVGIDDIEVIGLNCSNTQATNFSFTPISPTSINISWTRGNGNEVLVVANEDHPVNIDPVNGKIYDTDSSFGSGEGVMSQAGYGGCAIYNGEGTQVLISHLLPDIPYYFAIYEYSSGGCYTTPGLTGSATLSCSSDYLLPFTEGFGTYSSPPPCWLEYRGSNGLGIGKDWFNDDPKLTKFYEEAIVYHESVTGGLAEDWLVSPHISIPSGPTFSLNFFEKQTTKTDDGSEYYIKISTDSQTDRATFTDLITYGETSFGTIYMLRSIDLSDYAGQSVYIAFVMVQNNGDDWFIDNISIDTTPARTNVAWKGTTSTDWNTGSNWEDSKVPTVYKNLTIPSGCADYPTVDETATCRNLTVLDGGSIVITNGANLNVDGNFAIGSGESGTFTMNAGSCIVSGDFLTELGSNTKILGGTLNFTNWKRSIYNRWSVGTITLSGGTINASNGVYFSPKDVTGIMNGPFIFNVGYSFFDSDSTWSTVTDGTIYLLGNVKTEFGGAFGCSNSTTSAIAYNLVINAPGHIINCNSGQNLIIKNNLTINAGKVSVYDLKSLNIKGSLTIRNGSYYLARLECDRSSTNINLTGNWINNGGDFWAGKNTVFLSGANQTISGKNIFYNLTKAAKSAAKLTFGSGASNKTTIKGALELYGASGDLLSLRSEMDGTQWEIDPQGTKNLDFLDVKDSKNINATSISACNLVNSGNNTNWDLPPAGAKNIIGNSAVCKGSSNVNYIVPGIEGATSYVWTLPSGASGTSTTNSILVNFDRTFVSGEMKVNGHNDCGDGYESTLVLTVNEIPVTPVITFDNGILQSNATNGNQWYYNYQPLQDAVNSTLIPLSDGDYFVIVTLNNCSSQPSNIVSCTSTGINDAVADNGINVYPNPTSDVVKIAVNNKFDSDFIVDIYDNIGILLKTIKKSKTETLFDVNLSKFSAGYYIIRIYNTSRYYQTKVIKK